MWCWRRLIFYKKRKKNYSWSNTTQHTEKNFELKQNCMIKLLHFMTIWFTSSIKRRTENWQWFAKILQVFIHYDLIYGTRNYFQGNENMYAKTATYQLAKESFDSLKSRSRTCFYPLLIDWFELSCKNCIWCSLFSLMNIWR